MKKAFFTTLLLILFSATITAQDLKVPKIFTDHMVLQRNENVRIWGWSKSNSVVSILLENETTVTSANDKGEWEAYLPKMKAGGPYTIEIESKEKITFKDVYFGDVWIAGGQSNMEWQIGNGIVNTEIELDDTEYPEVRFFRVVKEISPNPIEDLITSAEWKVASKENARDFSAVAWFFAKHNHLEKGVPVGIIDDNWGGTPAETWVPTSVLINVPGYEEKATQYLDSEIDWELKIAENAQKSQEKYKRVQDTEEILNFGVHIADYVDVGWQNIELPNKEPLEDYIWLRKTFELKNIADAELSFGNPGKFTVTFINGINVYTKIWSDDPKIIEIDKSLLREGKNVIAIRTVEDWSNQTFIGSEENFWIKTKEETIELNGSWKFSNRIEPPMEEVLRYENEPGFLYNAMIHPIAGYTIKGAIWYQGESNVGAHKYYKVLFETMIKSWRDAWNQGDFPFLFAQLANYQTRYTYPTESDWARLQEAQTQTLGLKNTGMATLIDVGEAGDIHPKNKQDVGYRLWQAARHVAFHEDNVFSGPMYRGHIMDGNRVIVSYNHIGKGLVNKKREGALAGFALAGSDSVFQWADARIQGDVIILKSNQVDNPVAIRYGWADNPDVSLYNMEGLPAVPFRTDDW